MAAIGTLSLYQIILCFKDPEKQYFENIEKEGFLKHCWKMRKCWYPAFSPFPKLLSNLSFFQVVKTLDCLEKSQVREKVCLQI